ncbi:MAG: hypothetical protein KZQ90_05050 [Candidatus Thiodiazotropha sp. (ex Codakia rugifera)]|nr:hypothetical protein [Candidatus Thiodiazotropha sp. (ex Codakia rugifera)]
MKQVYLAGFLFVAGCSEPVDVELFNYQACRKQMTEAFTQQGVDSVAANMKAKVHCEEKQ